MSGVTGFLKRAVREPLGLQRLSERRAGPRRGLQRFRGSKLWELQLPHGWNAMGLRRRRRLKRAGAVADVAR